jgi:hypothetical protein
MRTSWTAVNAMRGFREVKIFQAELSRLYPYTRISISLKDHERKSLVIDYTTLVNLALRSSPAGTQSLPRCKSLKLYGCRNMSLELKASERHQSLLLGWARTTRRAVYPPSKQSTRHSWAFPSYHGITSWSGQVGAVNRALRRSKGSEEGSLERRVDLSSMYLDCFK